MTNKYKRKCDTNSVCQSEAVLNKLNIIDSHMISRFIGIYQDACRLATINGFNE